MESFLFHLSFLHSTNVSGYKNNYTIYIYLYDMDGKIMIIIKLRLC